MLIKHSIFKQHPAASSRPKANNTHYQFTIQERSYWAWAKHSNKKKTKTEIKKYILDKYWISILTNRSKDRFSHRCLVQASPTETVEDGISIKHKGSSSIIRIITMLKVGLIISAFRKYRDSSSKTLKTKWDQGTVVVHIVYMQRDQISLIKFTTWGPGTILKMQRLD